MKQVKIRAEKPCDYLGITNANDLAFRQKNEGILVQRLRLKPEFDKRMSLVAEREGKIIGHALFFPVKIGPSVSLSIGPVAVLPDFQKKRIGTRLVKAGLEKAKKAGYKSAIVLGHPEYYPKFGFKKASEWGINCPFPAPDEAFMALELAPGALKKTKGKVAFPPEYADAV